VYNPLRNSSARPGDLVAVQGIGGLGHLAVQFAHKMGFKVAALSRGTDKKELAMKLGADAYIDSEAENVVEKLQNMGGARIILATAPNSDAITSVIDGLGRNGEVIVVAADMEPIKVTPVQLIGGRRSISGWPSGHARDSEDTLNFSALTQVTPMIETFPLERASEAYDRMMASDARFRSVLVMNR
jgi:alcohol dehydrogenase/propanol-preferring alcohol dehydrogenase